MSIADEAAQLRSIDLPMGAIHQAQQELEAAVNLARSLIGPDGLGTTDIGYAAAHVRAQFEASITALAALEEALFKAAAQHLGS